MSTMKKHLKKCINLQKKKQEIIDKLRLKYVSKIYQNYIKKITNIQKNSQQNNSEKLANENGKEIPKERYLSPEERYKSIDNLRAIITV